MKTKLLYILTLLLIAAFPLGNTFFRVFRGLSVSSLHFFEKTASFTVSLPPLFHKYIHFYVTDFWIVGLLIFALALREVSWKELFWNRHSRFLTCYGGIACLSIALSLFATYFFQYTVLLNFLIATTAFHLIFTLFSRREKWIHLALWAFIGVAALDCLIGT